MNKNTSMNIFKAGDLFSKISSINYQLTEEKCKRFVKEIVKVTKGPLGPRAAW